MARKRESRFLITFMTIIQTGPVDSCWIICMMKLFENKHVDCKCIGSWCLNISKIRGGTRISDLFISTNQEQFGEYLSAVALSLPDYLDPNLFHRWRQWGSWVAPGSRALHCIGAHHWCPPEQNVQNAILVNRTLQMYKLAPMHRIHWPEEIPKECPKNYLMLLVSNSSMNTE